MSKPGLLLINLGSPDAPTPAAVKTYLTQFLTDRFVIDLGAFARQILVRGLIVPFRAGKSAEAYQKVWRKNGSPLVHFTREFTIKVARELEAEFDVRWAMRYGNPSIESQIKDWKVDELYVVPLYPQYAESSSRTAIEDALIAVKKAGLKVRVLEDFFKRPEFIKPQTAQIQHYIEEFQPDHVMLSFHGLPEHHLTKIHPQHCLQSANCCDEVGASNRYCYRAQAFATARAIQGGLQFGRENTSVSFQSRLGRRPWIKPYTDLQTADLVAAGVRRLLVSCPSFVADCLETLEEIEIRLRDQFIAEGGTELRLVPALNDQDEWAKSFAAMIRQPDLPWTRKPRADAV